MWVFLIALFLFLFPSSSSSFLHLPAAPQRFKTRPGLTIEAAAAAAAEEHRSALEATATAPAAANDRDSAFKAAAAGLKVALREGNEVKEDGQFGDWRAAAAEAKEDVEMVPGTGKPSSPRSLHQITLHGALAKTPGGLKRPAAAYKPSPQSVMETFD